MSGNNNTTPTPTSGAVESFVNNLTKQDVASVSGAGVSIQLRSEKEIAEGETARKALSFNPLKYWSSRDRNARQ